MTDDEPVRFESRIALVLRADLPAWQKLNMTAFLASGIAHAAAESVGKPYYDADGTEYLAMFGQPVMVFGATAAELTRTLDRALSRGITPAVFTQALFSTGHDSANRAAVAAVPRAGLDLAGLALRGDRRDVDKITKGLHLHA
jgi:hypothetical protein